MARLSCAFLSLPSRGHQEKIRQRQSILPPPQSPAPIPFQRQAGDSPQAKNRVGLPLPVPFSEPGRLRGGWGLLGTPLGVHGEPFSTCVIPQQVIAAGNPRMRSHGLCWLRE